MAFCTLYGSCGGCSLQHIDYKTQLEFKRKSLSFATGILDVLVFPSKERNYRNRMEFLASESGLGLRRPKGGFIAVETCPLLEEWLCNLLKETNEFCIDNAPLLSALSGVVIRGIGSSSAVSFVLKSKSTKLREAADAIKKFNTSAKNVIGTYADGKDSHYSDNYFIAKGSDRLTANVMGKEFIYPVQGFFQNNTAMAELMQEYCGRLFSSYDTKGAHLLDLFSGVGIFGIVNSALFSKVTMVEGSKLSVECAIENIRANNAPASAFAIDSSQLGRLKLPEGLFIIADPPRSGMDMKTIDQIKRLKPGVFVYVSCNIEHLKKDIPKFKGYNVKSAAMFDFFPQTPHFESVVELVRK